MILSDFLERKNKTKIKEQEEQEDIPDTSVLSEQVFSGSQLWGKMCHCPLRYLRLSSCPGNFSKFKRGNKMFMVLGKNLTKRPIRVQCIFSAKNKENFGK